MEEPWLLVFLGSCSSALFSESGRDLHISLTSSRRPGGSTENSLKRRRSG